MKKTVTVTYHEFEHFNALPAQEIEMIQLAYQIAEDAYAPYSKFHVGAVALLADGTLVKGSNQENIAYPSGLCAERVALFFAGANYPNVAIEKLVVIAKGDLIQPDDCVSPCGSCRQVISESERRQATPMQVILVSESGRTFVFDRGTDLLIFPFGIQE